MNKKTEIILTNYNNTSLDLYSNDDFAITFSISDIRYIESRQTNYSKYFIIPGTPINNKVFGHIFDINTYEWTYNINLKTNCKVIVDGQLLLDGYLKLNRIIKRNEDEGFEYSNDFEIIVYDKTASFFDNIKQKTLSDLDLSRYNHTLTLQNIVDSFLNTSGYTYPLLKKANQNGNNWVPTDFQPAFYLKTVWDEIFLSNGFAYESDFLNSDPFNKLIIFNNSQIKNEPTILNNLRFITQNTGTTTLDLADNNHKYNGSSTFIYNSTKANYSIGNRYVYGEFAKVVEVDGTIYNNGGMWTGNTYTPTAEHQGELSFIIDFDLTLTNNQSFNVIVNDNADKKMYLKIYIVEEQEDYIYINTERRGYGGNWFNPEPGDIKTLKKTNKKIVGEYTISVDNPIDYWRYSLLPGGSVSTNIQTSFIIPNVPFKKDKKYQIYASSNCIEFNFTVFEDNGFVSGLFPGDFLELGTVINNIQIKHTPKENEYREGNTIYMNNFLKKEVKQIDFIKSVINLFNLYIDKHQTKEKTFIIKTRDDYYSDYSTWDWTNKIDLAETELFLLSDLQEKKIKYEYQNLNTQFGKEYLELVEKNYGNFEVLFENEYLTGEKKISNIFTIPSTIYSNSDTKVYIPNIAVSDASNSYYIMYAESVLYTADTIAPLIISGATSSANLTYYKQALHTDNFEDPNFTLSYNWPEFDSIDSDYYTDNGLYNLYWSSYVRQIANSKMISGYFNLSSEDVNKLKLSDRIKIDNNYYIINNIYEFALNREDVLTKCELILYNEDYRYIPQPKKVYTTSEIGQLVSKLKQQKESFDSSSLINNLNRGTNNETSSQNEIIAGTNNTVVQNQNAVVVGNNNIVSRKYVMGAPPEPTEEIPDGLLMVGNNNKINNDDTLLVIGSNVFLEPEDDVVAKIGNFVITKGGSYSEFNIVNPGEDIVYDERNPFNMHLIDPGEDVVVGLGGEGLINLIDAGEDVVL